MDEENPKTLEIKVQDKVVVSEAFGWKSVHEYYEKHPIANITILFLTIAGALIGLWLSVYIAVVASLVLGLGAYILGLLFATIKVREINKGGDSF